MKPESDDSNPINSLYDMRLILIITIYPKDIYTFCIFSEYNGRPTPLEMKYQNSFLSIQQSNTALKIIHLKINIMMRMISKVKVKINFQSFFIQPPYRKMRYLKFKWSKPTIIILIIIIYKITSLPLFKNDLNLLNCFKIEKLI